MPVDVRDPEKGTIYRVHNTNDPEVARRRVRTELQRQGRRIPGGASMAQRDAAGALSSFNSGFPFVDEASAVMRGVAEAAPTALDIAPPPERSNRNYGARVGEAFNRGFQMQRAFDRESRTDFLERRPNAANFATGSGMAAPIVMTMGGSTAPQVATANAPRGLSLFGQQTARAATTGAAAGTIYGAGNSDEDTLEGRLDSANEGAALGAAFGAATPAAVNTLRAGWRVTEPIRSGVARYLERIPTPHPNSVGAMGRPMRPPRPPRVPPQPPELSPATQRRLPALADRARMSADDVETAVGSARRDPQGQTLVDVFGDAGVRQLRPMAAAPGRTGSLAAETAGNRAQAAPDILTGALRRTLNVSETRGAALRRLQGEYERASAETYTPVLRQPLASEQQGRLDRILQSFADDPIFADAVKRAERIFARDRRLGLVSGDINASYPRYAHYLKMALDDTVTAAPMGSRGLQATEMRGVNEMRRRVIEALDQNIPGYREARARWGGLHEAEEALDEGAAFLKSDAEEVQARIAEMTPFQREHARIGLAHELQQRIGLAGNTSGNVNVANIQALRSPEMQRRLSAVFETPEQAAEFLGTARTQNQLMRNAAGWNGGSATQGNQAYEADGVAAARADVGGAAMRSPGHALNEIARKAGNALFDGAVERSNNQFGQDLLRRIDGPEARRFTEEVVRLLREQEAAAYRASQVSRLAATSGGAVSGKRRD